MGLGRIPWDAALAWAEREGFDGEETESLIDLIEKLDVKEIELERERLEREGKKGGKRDGKDG